MSCGSPTSAHQPELPLMAPVCIKRHTVGFAKWRFSISAIPPSFIWRDALKKSFSFLPWLICWFIIYLYQRGLSDPYIAQWIVSLITMNCFDAETGPDLASKNVFKVASVSFWCVLIPLWGSLYFLEQNRLHNRLVLSLSWPGINCFSKESSVWFFLVVGDI